MMEHREMTPIEKQMDRGPSYSFELGPIRPPSEGQDHSLLIRATRNCSWNRCTFCNAYKGSKFEYRSVAEIKGEVDVAKRIADLLRDGSWRTGLGGRVTSSVIRNVIAGNPDIYGNGSADPEGVQLRLHNLLNVAMWLNAGAKTVFLQDANTMIIRTHELIEVLEYLRQTFPTVERITSYARAKTVAKRSLDELTAIAQAGLSRIHIGLESGCDDVLQAVQKGVSAEEHIQAGQKVIASGISLSEYVMPGLGGRKFSREHALNTARVLNEIGKADFVRLRSLVLRTGSPLYQQAMNGEFDALSEDEVVEEIGIFVENLHCDSYLISDQMSNLLWEIEGRLPQDKQRILEVIEGYSTLPSIDRLKLRLHRRLNAYLSVYGRMDARVGKLVEEAFESLESGVPEAGNRVEAAISAMKKGFV